MADFTLQDQQCLVRLADSGPRDVASDYEHDRVTVDDLLLLGIPNAGPVSDHPVIGSGPSLLVTDRPVKVPVVHVVPSISTQVADFDGPTRAPGVLRAPELVSASASEPTFGLLFDDQEDGFADGWAEPEQLEVPWDAEIPEPEDDLTPNADFELATGVHATERAMQQALEFLQDAGLSNTRNLDLLTDIILERGWSSVQAQVKSLVHAGYSVDQIHLMFQITGVWLQCVQSETLAPEGWHGGHRLTWHQAARLLDVMGYDAEVEEIADFFCTEQEAWNELRRWPEPLAQWPGALATFRDYLFKYRLSIRTEVGEGIWQSNLNPSDERSFDGARHGLYSPDWWDEPTGDPESEFARLLQAGCDLVHITERCGMNPGVYG